MNSTQPMFPSAEISVSTAARIARTSHDTILRLIQDGSIEARRVRKRSWWKVDYNSLIQFLSRNFEK